MDHKVELGLPVFPVQLVTAELTVLTDLLVTQDLPDLLDQQELQDLLVLKDQLDPLD